MTNAIQVRSTGGPEVLEFGEAESASAGPHELAVEVAAAGVNFIDTYQRGGVYPMNLPFVPGMEGAGRVIEVGSEVADFLPGDRVCWSQTKGSYAERAVIPASDAVRVPEDVHDEVAAAIPLQGMTAHYLVASSYPVQQGDTVLVHAAAGGVGLLLTQLAKARGARVLGTVSTPDKERLAKEAGADEVYGYSDFAERVRETTNGEGVAAVYDGVGRTTFDDSLSCVRRRGSLVLFGGSSGQVPPVDPQRLNSQGSIFLTRPTLRDYMATRDELEWRIGELFDAIAAGALQVRIGGRYPLDQARQAHEDLEGRKTTGKLLLLP
ncbi:NADPH2:quinone reductase [Tamaricihabitans halophyticus]|uniref:NADPH2:quinone reductase n=1 Tax=Tamaricihabitans halophyticus TaxID=1262583 RepID=A0A4R2QGN3_9PSEU|nr:quinone oxidoreductase [Tamaricihabitans halophyticus]TCP46221.1 NADPH2:quinone reductase [Tamaricihabitans halophyticus]